MEDHNITLKNYGEQWLMTQFVKQWRSWIPQALEQKLHHDPGKDDAIDY